MARQGREALTPERQEKICQLLRDGNYISVACKIAGISHKTFTRWLKRGESEKTGKYVKFVKAVKKAEAENEARAVTIIQQAMPKSWQAAMTFLERKYPQRWARREYVEAKIGNEDGKEIREKAESDPEFLDLLFKLQRKIDSGESHANRLGELNN